MTLTLSPEDREEIAQLVADKLAKIIPSAPANPLLTVAQAAKRKGVSIPTFRAWMAKGYITPLPELQEARFPQSKIDALFSK